MGQRLGHQPQLKKGQFSCHHSLPQGFVSLTGVTAQELLCAPAGPTQDVVLSPSPQHSTPWELG